MRMRMTKACQLYIKAVEVSPNELYLMVDKSFLGVSSDGKLLVALEIKCPFSIDKCITIELSTNEFEEKFGQKFYMKLYREKMEGFINRQITCSMLPLIVNS